MSGESETKDMGKEQPPRSRELPFDRFAAKLDEMAEIHQKKGADYGNDRDDYANFRGSTAFGVAPWVGALIRMQDKIYRLQSLVTQGKLENESAEDSLRDLAVYAVIAWVLFEEELDAENHSS